MVAQGTAGEKGSNDRLGRYEIISRIGEGAMGEVFKARDVVLDRFVAVKTMSANIVGKPDMGQRFLREAQSAARLNHPNVVTLHEFGEDAGRYFMAMELLEGEDLSRSLRHNRLPSIEEKLAVIEQILDGVGYAHAAGVIHRDLKPANIHITKNGHIKVMDFGLARLGESEITQAGTVMGTPHYMSPEQVLGEKTGPASDVFSLGAMCYEILSGKRAFEADSMHAVLFKVTQSEPAPFTEIAPDVPPIVTAFVWKALAKSPQLRYQNAGQMREALDICRGVMEGALDEESAIGSLGEARTILQTPAEANGTSAATEDPEATIAAPAARSMRTGSMSPLSQTARPSTAVRRAKTAPPSRVAPPPVATPREAPRSGPSGAVIGIGVVAIAIIGGLLYVIFKPAPPPAPTQDLQSKAVFSLAIEGQLDAAKRALELKDPEGAITAAQKALQFDPTNATAMDIVSRARASLDQVEADAREARRAAEAGDLDGASRSLAKVLEVMPKHPVADELSAQLASRFKARADDAAREMTRSAEAARRAGASSTRAYGEAAAQSALAQAAYDKKQFTEAMQHYAQAKRAYDTSSRDAAALAAKAPTPATVAQKAVETPAPVVSTPPPTPQRPAPTPASTPVVVAATPVAPAPPTPAPRPAVDEDAAVRQIVSRLKAAIEQKDLAQYKVLRPDLTADEERRLSDAFRNVASQQVDYSIESVAIDGDKATLKVTRRGRVSGQNVPAVKQTLRLTKTAHGWVITEIGQ